MIPTDHEFADRIRALLPVNGLEPWLQEQVLAQGELVSYKRRAYVFKEGDDDPYSFFLVDGQIEMRSGDWNPTKVTAGTEEALRALAQLRPRCYSARCVRHTTLFRIKRTQLEHILSQEQISTECGSLSQTESQASQEVSEELDWMSKLLTSELMTRLPPNNIARFFGELEPLPVMAGEEVIRQGTSGEYLYIAAEGRFSVVRLLPGAQQEQELAVLSAGDVFGEEALISELPRNATVRAQSDGLVMRLGRQSFNELVTKVTLRPVAYDEAAALVADGAVWLDVRFAEEFQNLSLDGALNLPLNQLRSRAVELDRAKQYIAYCDSGGRGSTAAFLLTRFQFDVRHLAGGLLHSPYADLLGGTGETVIPPELDLDKEMSGEFLSGGPAALEETVADAGVTKEAPAESNPGLAPDPLQNPTVSAQRLGGGSLQADMDAAGEQLEAQRSRYEQALNNAQLTVRRVTQERDKIAAQAEKAVRVARQLKNELEHTHRALSAQQTKAQSEAQNQGFKQAEYERRLALETARLHEESQALEARLQQVSAEHKALQESRGAERQEEATVLDELRAQQQEASDRQHQLEAQLLEARNAFEQTERTLKDELDSAKAHAAVLTVEADTANARAEALEARFETARQTMLEQDSQLQDVAAKKMAHLEQEAARISAGSAALEAQKAAFQDARTALEALHAEAAVEIEKAELAWERRQQTLAEREAKLDERKAELDEREQAMADSVAQMQAQTRRELDGHIAEVERERVALAADKATWNERIEAEIGEERKRIERAQERLAAATLEMEAARASAEAEAKTTVQALQVERDALNEKAIALQRQEEALELARQTETVELNRRELFIERAQGVLRQERASLEQLTKEQEAVLATRIQEAAQRFAEKRLAKLKAVAEAKLKAQSALFADVRLKLESEIVRLKEVIEQPRSMVAQHGQRLQEVAPSSPAELGIANRGNTSDGELDEQWVIAAGGDGDVTPIYEHVPEDTAWVVTQEDSAANRIMESDQLELIRARIEEKMAIARKASSS